MKNSRLAGVVFVMVAVVGLAFHGSAQDTGTVQKAVSGKDIVRAAVASANSLVAAGKFEDAVRVSDEAISRLPKDSLEMTEAQNMKIRSLGCAGKYKEAAGVLQKARADNPTILKGEALDRYVSSATDGALDGAYCLKMASNAGDKKHAESVLATYDDVTNVFGVVGSSVIMARMEFCRAKAMVILGRKDEAVTLVRNIPGVYQKGVDRDSVVHGMALVAGALYVAGHSRDAEVILKDMSRVYGSDDKTEAKVMVVRNSGYYADYNNRLAEAQAAKDRLVTARAVFAARKVELEAEMAAKLSKDKEALDKVVSGANAELYAINERLDSIRNSWAAIASTSNKTPEARLASAQAKYSMAKVLEFQGKSTESARMLLLLATTHACDGDAPGATAVVAFKEVTPASAGRDEYKAACKKLLNELPRTEKNAQFIGMIKAKLSDLYPFPSAFPDRPCPGRQRTSPSRCRIVSLERCAHGIQEDCS